MTLTDKQLNFLSNELGIQKFKPHLMSPYELWKLREDLIDLECNEDIDPLRRDEAAKLVDYMKDTIPKEWRLLTPSEVEAILSGSEVGA